MLALQPVYCVNAGCKTQIKPGTRFCPACGRDQVNLRPADPPEPPPAPEPLDWERIDIRGGDSPTLACYRAKVPGGWLVMFNPAPMLTGFTEKTQPSVTFFPDPEHAWQVKVYGKQRG